MNKKIAAITALTVFATQVVAGEKMGTPSFIPDEAGPAKMIAESVALTADCGRRNDFDNLNKAETALNQFGFTTMLPETDEVEAWLKGPQMRELLDQADMYMKCDRIGYYYESSLFQIAKNMTENTPVSSDDVGVKFATIASGFEFFKAIPQGQDYENLAVSGLQSGNTGFPMEISGLVTRHSLKEELKAHPAYLTQDQHMKAYYSSDNPHDYAMSVVRDIMSAGKSFDF